MKKMVLFIVLCPYIFWYFIYYFKLASDLYHDFFLLHFWASFQYLVQMCRDFGFNQSEISISEAAYL